MSLKLDTQDVKKRHKHRMNGCKLRTGRVMVHRVTREIIYFSLFQLHLIYQMPKLTSLRRQNFMLSATPQPPLPVKFTNHPCCQGNATPSGNNNNPSPGYTYDIYVANNEAAPLHKSYKTVGYFHLFLEIIMKKLCDVSK